MSRRFISNTGAGGNRRDLTKSRSLLSTLNFSRKRRKTMNELVRERSTHQVKDYKEMVEDLLDEKMTSTSRPRQFNLPGVAPPKEQEITKGRQMAIEHFKMKRMKQRLKTRERKVEVIPKLYTGPQGGWIDKKGRIRNSHGLIVMEVNLNTGVITNRLGFKVGRYNPQSYANDFKIQRLIQRYTKHQHRHDNPFAGADQHDAPFNPFGPKE